ncbi:hypothetical protein SLH46_11650 [Draconibacterium sp. IB214405]|uniref:hypothetical protein n=1 Tax=Draconibacterium sp. IB214405 TaxID=3097352 RepID=UPI002A106258|nr:hypothetical protein [Draconibacterium sp. IB214405]MDX8339842.1 hypothetical protein [Draconibacterium sp. IB214405]
MSFKIFSLQLTGKIKSVDTIEKKRKQLDDDYATFLKTESSDELKAFLELEEYVNSADFKAKKKETENLSFKGSEEENQEKELQRLQKSARIRNYFKVEGSSDLVRYQKDKESQKLSDFYALEDYVKEGDFEKDKKEVKSQVFKGSSEEKHLAEFKKLEKSAGIKAFNEYDGSEKLKNHKAFEASDKFKRYNELKTAAEGDKEKQKEFKSLSKDQAVKNYFKFEKSKKLKLYHEIAGSHNLTRYKELKELVNSEDFKKKVAYLKDKKKFEKSEAFKKYSEYKKLLSDSVVTFVLKYEKSKLYKNYLDVKESFDLKRHNELKEIIDSEEYKKQKAWLEDKKRWEKTEDCKKYKQYESDKKNPEIVKYFKYKDSTDFDFYKNWELVFEDSFAEAKLDAGKWTTSGMAAASAIGQNYAMPGDLSIFTNGSNIETGNKLSIKVKKENKKGMVWQMPAGFVPAEFDYTSGLICSGENFQVEDGIVEAKIKFNPVKQVASSFYLSAANNVPRVNLVEMGAKNILGVYTLNGGGKIASEGLEIDNLKKGDYIFSLEKSGANFTWKINETEVLQLSNSELNKPLVLNVSSLVVDQLSGSANFDVEWVKCYKKK